VQRQALVNDVWLSDGIIGIDRGKGLVVRRGYQIAGSPLFSRTSNRCQRSGLTGMLCRSKAIVGRRRLRSILLPGRCMHRLPCIGYVEGDPGGVMLAALRLPRAAVLLARQR
jgi:hypothetical protein